MPPTRILLDRTIHGKFIMTAESTLYSLHEPLPASPDHIRVIDLLPGTGFLACNLRSVPLDKARYETVSYHWTAAFVHDPTIVINNHEVKIRQSLAAALRRLRLPSITRTLWVDALCINQDSNAEKSDQVSKMRRIYESGSRNNIWLGEHDGSTARVIELVKDITSEARRSSFDIHAVTSEIMLNPESPFYLLLRFCDRPWFHRGWVVQEVTVAQVSTVYCGDYEMPWDKISMARDMLMPAMGMVYDTMNNQKLAYIKGTDDLASVLARNISYEVTDVRDRVYSMLGLLSEDKQYSMEADYNADADDVLLRATYRCIERRGDLDILSVVATKTGNDHDRPSWVLASSFSWQDNTMPFQAFAWRAQLLSNARGPIFSCSGNSIVSCSLTPHDNGLELTGQIFGRVDRVNIPYSPAAVRATRFGFFFDIIQGIHPWLDWRRLAGVGSDRIYPWTQEPMHSVYWQTTSGGVLPEHYSTCEKLFAGFEDTYKAMHLIPPYLWSCRVLIGLVLVYCLVVARVKMMFGNKDVVMFFEQCATIRNRKSFTTNNGAFGLGPKALEAGDTVFVLKGGKVPLILRPSGREGHWALIGESYVHGIMHGEAYREELCEPLTIV